MGKENASQAVLRQDAMPALTTTTTTTQVEERRPSSEHNDTAG